MKRWIVPLLVLLLTCAEGSRADDTSRPVEVKTWVSWAGVHQPEVHLLILNRTDRDLAFIAHVGAGVGGERSKCAGNLREVDPGYIFRMIALSHFPSVASRGVVSHRGWAHRSYPLGREGAVPPCDVPFLVEFDDVAVHPIPGRVEVAKPSETPSLHDLTPVSDDPLSTQVLVEDNQATDGLVARVLVRNAEDHPLQVEITDRGIDCEGEAKARWALHEGPDLGESVGPMLVPAVGWGAFVAVIDAPQGEAAGQCTGWVDVAVRAGPRVWKHVTRARFQLAPVGYYARDVHRDEVPLVGGQPEEDAR